MRRCRSVRQGDPYQSGFSQPMAEQATVFCQRRLSPYSTGAATTTVATAASTNASRNTILFTPTSATSGSSRR